MGDLHDRAGQMTVEIGVVVSLIITCLSTTLGGERTLRAVCDESREGMLLG